QPKGRTASWSIAGGARPRGSCPRPRSRAMAESRTRSSDGRKRAKREAEEEKPPARPDLKVIEIHVFRGPNFWSYEPCIRMLVDLGSLEHWPSNTLKGFNEGILEMLPGLRDHSCSLGRPGGFVERLEDGTWAGHVAEHVALQRQRETGIHIPRGKTRSAGQIGQYNVIYGYGEESVGLASGKLAVRLVNHLVEPDPEFDFLDEL